MSNKPLCACHDGESPCAFHRAYQVTGRLGKGGMGAVYQARQRSTGRNVAIKFMLHTGCADDRARFDAETRALVALQHPHILSIVDAGCIGDRPYLVTELMSGGTLRARMPHGQRQSPGFACETIGQVLSGLVACHRAGIVHRDVKPENIMLDRDGRAKLADLGLAKIGGVNLTQDGEVMGSPMYMAPEQLTGQPVSPATDLYAVGVILYELLFGCPPLTAGSLPELIVLRTTGRLSLPPHRLPPPLSLLLQRLLDSDPANRPRSAAEALRLLGAVTSTATSSGSRVLVPSRAVAAPARRERRLGTHALSCVLGIMLGCVGQAAIWQRPQADATFVEVKLRRTQGP